VVISAIIRLRYLNIVNVVDNATAVVTFSSKRIIYFVEVLSTFVDLVEVQTALKRCSGFHVRQFAHEDRFFEKEMDEVFFY